MTNTIEHDALSSTMHQAFELVKPPTHWKARIEYRARPEDLASALKGRGVTLEQVCAAIIFYTATEATVETRADGFTYITAAGYWAGPAN